MEEFFDSEEAEHGKDPSNPRASQTLPAISSPPHLSLEADLGWGRGGAGARLMGQPVGSGFYFSKSKRVTGSFQKLPH